MHKCSAESSCRNSLDGFPLLQVLCKSLDEWPVALLDTLPDEWPGPLLDTLPMV